MTEVQTNADLMIQTEKDVDSYADSLTGLLNGLMDELAPLYDQWKGAGAGSFQQVRDRFDQDMAHLNRALRSIAEAVGSAGKDYNVSDEEVKSEMEQAGATAGQITQALSF